MTLEKAKLYTLIAVYGWLAGYMPRRGESIYAYMRRICGGVEPRDCLRQLRLRVGEGADRGGREGPEDTRAVEEAAVDAG
jgi:hypothetical protein